MKLKDTDIAKPLKEEIEMAKTKSKQYIVCKATAYGSHVYAPGQIIDLPEDEAPPENVMALENSGPHYFALKECSRNGITFKPGELWNRPACQEPAPAGLFALLTQRADFEFQPVSNDPRGELRRRSI